MSEESPQTARARAFYGNGPRLDKDLKPVAKLVQPGEFSDGLPREGTRPEQIHREKPVHYGHPKAKAYREDLRERPSAPTKK
jgi:hypothetical protein